MKGIIVQIFKVIRQATAITVNTNSVDAKTVQSRLWYSASRTTTSAGDAIGSIPDFSGKKGNCLIVMDTFSE